MVSTRAAGCQNSKSYRLQHRGDEATPPPACAQLLAKVTTRCSYNLLKLGCQRVLREPEFLSRFRQNTTWLGKTPLGLRKNATKCSDRPARRRAVTARSAPRGYEVVRRRNVDHVEEQEPGSRRRRERHRARRDL